MGSAGIPASRLLLVERYVEENNLSRHIFAPQAIEVGKAVSDDYVRGNTLRRRGMISAQGSEHNLLRRSRSLSGILDQFGGFRASYPMARLHRLQTHVQTELAHF